MSVTAFARFWQTDLTRECFLSYVPKDDLRSLRLGCKAFADDVAPALFKTLELRFSTNTFSRRARMCALNRIGHHVRQLSFVMPHTADTFLPPLLIPGTLEEVTFLYEPRVNSSRPHSSSSSTSSSSTSKYGSWEMNDLLVKQYPPMFHAATNVDAFFRAISAMPRLRHLHISCPGQQVGHRYRKDIVDYALISLRLAIEAANPTLLDTLTLAPIHPSATFYLRPHLTVGSSPTSSRVWRRIKSLNIEMDSFEFGRDEPADHLKILHSYLQTLQCLETFKFTWLGTWDDALAPLTRILGDDSWKQKQEEVMVVPIMLSPVEEKREIECVQDHLWDDVLRKSRGLQVLRRVSLRTKELLPEQVRRLLRTARVAWH
ncbi:hypothetical protein H2200_000010 [Cladophialophora chaetospira]|uniref:Uncharacterized protein n=1 Tax=Cladophialophora chaetospira TaxID=386627 RepID=A0AA38XMR9_9EURO|nr:hypothetical protein H2200_000010 [Cladophialophora chaetospira]